jgi:tetratricopeptide (TPR) repeat protein
MALTTHTLSLALGLFLGAAQADDAASPKLDTIRAELKKGDTRTAVIELKNLILESPQNVEARLLLGDTYLSIGDVNGAAGEFERVQRASANAETWLIPLSRAYILQGKSKEALRLLETEPVQESLKPQVLAQRGRAHLALQERDQAAADFAEALSLAPDNAEALLGQGTLANLSGEFAKAIVYCDQVLAKDPANVGAWILKAKPPASVAITMPPAKRSARPCNCGPAIFAPGWAGRTFCWIRTAWTRPAKKSRPS